MSSAILSPSTSQVLVDFQHASSAPDAERFDLQDQFLLLQVTMAEAAAPAAPITFALAPALASNTVLDYTTRDGAKLFSKATEALDTPFDMRAKNLKLFVEELSIRTVTFGWGHIMGIPKNLNIPLGETDSLLTAYGKITVEKVRSHAESYVASQARGAQDSYQLYLCIMGSLTKEAKSRIVLQKDQYTINGTPSGALLLRLVIQESSIDTKATTRFLREQLSSLNTLMTEKESNIIDFNESVRGLLDSLAARGESTQDLLSNLFKGYEAASDEQFVKYVLKKQDEYDEGAEITADTLMLLMAQKYRTLVQAGKWNAPDEKMEKIIALEATIKKLQKATKPKTEKKSTEKPKKDKKKGKGKADKGRKPEWMLVKPKENESKKKTVDDKVYHWCATHNSWTRHSPSECKGLGGGNETKDHKKDSDKKVVSFSPKLTVSKALKAVAEDEDYESD